MSHNNMATFFSGTDTSTLLAEGQDRNNIVSLIVNNEGTYSAAITRCVISEAKVEEKGTYKFFGEGEKSFTDSYEVEDIYIEYFMLDIVKKEPKGLQKFVNRLKEVMAPKPTVSAYPFYTSQSRNSYYTEPIISKPVEISKPVISTSGVDKTYMCSSALPFTSIGPIGKSPEPIFDKKEEKTEFNQFNPLNPIKTPKDDKKEVDELIELLTLQLVTGNIFATFKEYTNLDVWVRTDMFRLFQNKFGINVSAQSDFVAWIVGHMEFILFYTKDSELEKYQQYDRAAILAEKIHDRMKKLPIQNIYIKAMMAQLQDYYEYTTI